MSLPSSFSMTEAENFVERIRLAYASDVHQLTWEVVGLLVPEMLAMPILDAHDYHWQRKFKQMWLASAYESAMIHLLRRVFPGWEYAMGDNLHEATSQIGWARIFPPQPRGQAHGSGNLYAATPALAILYCILDMKIREHHAAPRAPR